jgi:hypothetical protein
MAAQQVPSGNITIKQTINQIITSSVSQYFGATLGQEKDIVNIVMAMCQLESSMGAALIGNLVGTPGVISSSAQSYAADYWFSSPVQAIVTANPAGSVPYNNAVVGLRALGCMQVMGGYFINNGSRSSGGNGPIQGSGKPFVSQLMVNAGSDLLALFTQKTTASYTNQILAGLTILESKYKYVTQVNGQWHYGKSSMYFPAKIQATVGAYLGLGTSDVNGMTPQAYASSICGGAMYAKANGSTDSTSVVNATGQQATSGQQVATSTATNQTPVGCTC